MLLVICVFYFVPNVLSFSPEEMFMNSTSGSKNSGLFVREKPRNQNPDVTEFGCWSNTQSVKSTGSSDTFRTYSIVLGTYIANFFAVFQWLYKMIVTWKFCVTISKQPKFFLSTRHTHVICHAHILECNSVACVCAWYNAYVFLQKEIIQWLYDPKICRGTGILIFLKVNLVKHCLLKQGISFSAFWHLSDISMSVCLGLWLVLL